MREHGALSRVAVGWGENTVGESAPSELASCFVGGTTSERVEKKRGSHGLGFGVAGPSGGPCTVLAPQSEAWMPGPKVRAPARKGQRGGRQEGRGQGRSLQAH